LLKLGIGISQSTVSKYMIRHRKPPSQSWKTFLDNHVGDLVSIDFFTVPTVTFNVLFVFVVLTHDRRRVLHFNVTGSPTANWTAQQIVEAFPWETAPRYLLRDRDSIYDQEFTERVVVLDENHLRQLVRRYLSYYHGFRTHLSLEKDTPDMRPVEPPDSSPTATIQWKSKVTGCVCSAPFVSLVKRRLMSAHMNPPDSRRHALVSFISKAVEIVGCNKWKRQGR
jgi:hypothetical protein